MASSFKAKFLFIVEYEKILTYAIFCGNLFISIFTYKIFRYEGIDDPDNKMIFIAIINSILIPILYLIVQKKNSK